MRISYIAIQNNCKIYPIIIKKIKIMSTLDFGSNENGIAWFFLKQTFILLKSYFPVSKHQIELENT